MHTDNPQTYHAFMQPVEQFYSQYDQYYEYFPTTPAPQVTLELPSDTESSRRPSQVSISQFSPSSSYTQLHQREYLCTTSSKRERRNSYSGYTPLPSPSNQPSMLNLPIGRSRGSSMPDSVSADDLYRMRSFSTSGKRIINRGDCILSRSNLSINHIGSR